MLARAIKRGRIEMKSVAIRMPYIGGVLSVNRYKYRGGFYTKREVRDWMDMLGWMVKGQHIQEWFLPLKVTCDGVFKDKRSQPDLSNLSKVILDAIEESTGINDRDMRWCDGEVRYGEPQELIITIEEPNE